MKLNYLEVSGFKLYERTHTFSFGMMNEILGDRGKGKTAICEAIVWCLKGRDLSRSSRGIVKRLKNRSTKEIHVVTRWEFSNPDGQPVCHELSRLSKGRSTHLYLDGRKADQEDFDALIGPTDLFLTIFSPGYFDGLAAAKARSVIMSLLPSQETSAVLESLTEEDRKHIASYDMTDPLRCMQELKAELDEWNEYIQDVTSRIGSIHMAESIGGGPSFYQQDDQKLETLKQELEKLSQTEPPALPDYFEEWEMERTSLGQEYREWVRTWQEVKKTPLAGINPRAEKARRQTELDGIKAKCEAALQQGYVLRDRMESERKHYEEDLADFERRKAYDLQQLSMEITKLEAKQGIRRQNSKIAERLPLMERQIKEGIEEWEKVLAIIQAVQNFMLQYANMQVEKANSVLYHAEILLTTKRETEGDITLQYRLLYNKKEYHYLSNSEKTRCSFELSGLTDQNHGRRIPVFVDNGESVREFMESGTQFFTTTVIPHAGLSHEVVA